MEVKIEYSMVGGGFVAATARVGSTVFRSAQETPLGAKEELIRQIKIYLALPPPETVTIGKREKKHG